MTGLIVKILGGVAGAGMLAFFVNKGINTVQTGIQRYATMQSEVVAKTAEAAAAQATLEEFEARLATEQARIRELETAFNQAEERYQEAVSIFNRHNLGELMEAKPGLIETRMRAATEKVWREIEAETRE